MEGHTDLKGGEEYNQILSERRAKAVYDKLDEYGMPKDKMSHKGHGETRPVDTTGTPEGDARNRRVEIIVED